MFMTMDVFVHVNQSYLQSIQELFRVRINAKKILESLQRFLKLCVFILMIEIQKCNHDVPDV